MKLGIYKNNRTGIEYFVRGFAVDSSNERYGTQCVVYHKKSDEFDVKYYVREINEFKKKFTFIEGR